MQLYRFTEEQADVAVKKYREHYAKRGVHENKVYAGMESFLTEARKKGLSLYVATSKVITFARQILDELGLSGYFRLIAGSMPDGSLSTKKAVIEYVIQEAGLTRLPEVIMVGDRKYDILGAKKAGVASAGVLYGYGSEEELAKAGADYIIPDIKALNSFFDVG